MGADGRPFVNQGDTCGTSYNPSAKHKVCVFNKRILSCKQGMLRRKIKDLINAPFTQLHPQGIRGVFKQTEIDEILDMTYKLVA